MFSNDVIIDTHEKKNELKSLEQMIIDRFYPVKSIIIADRSYEKYSLFTLCMEQSQYFLIRAKDITSNGILSTISSEEYEDEFDIDTVKINKKGIENEISENQKKHNIYSEISFHKSHPIQCNSFHKVAYSSIQTEKKLLRYLLIKRRRSLLYGKQNFIKCYFLSWKRCNR